MNDNQKPSQNLLFGQNSNSQNNQEMQMDSKFQNRQEQFVDDENFSKIKESTISQEYSISQDNRNKTFLKMRLHKKINEESKTSIFNCLSMPKEVYENLGSE